MLAEAALLLSLALAAAAPGAAEGRRLFFDPGLGKNGVACSHCHATVRDEAKDGDGLIRPGHTLFNVTKRRSWRGDLRKSSYTSAAEAADVCVQVFQGGRPLEGRERAALVKFLESLSPGPHQRPLVVQPALEANLDYARPQYRSGNTEDGRALFYAACHGCHPHGRAGLGRLAIAGKPVAEVVAKVREGNGMLRGARNGSDWMPFFGRDRLSDRQVADIAAFVEALPPP